VTLNVGPKSKGTVVVHFYSVDDLERLLELMRVPE
jgi:hypothetical protein